MNETNHSAVLARAADRASQRPEYLGWLFREYAEIEKTTAIALAETLGVSMLDYQHLRLCLRPRAESFAADVRQIGARFSAQVDELAKIIRHVEALAAMSEETSKIALQEAGWLMAARARGKGTNSKRKGNNPADHEKS